MKEKEETEMKYTIRKLDKAFLKLGSTKNLTCIIASKETIDNTCALRNVSDFNGIPIKHDHSVPYGEVRFMGGNKILLAIRGT